MSELVCVVVECTELESIVAVCDACGTVVPVASEDNSCDVTEGIMDVNET